tara:strand:- start:7200 stop:7733 length:534 start_codon:yes stop_codon:yes gene_type:complete
MGHYAKVNQGKVVKVIVAEASFFNNFVDDSPGTWLQTSYNTRNGIHYEPNSNTPSPVVYLDNSGSRFFTESEASEYATSSGSLPITASNTSLTLALRGNYAGIGYEYDSSVDAFFYPQPFSSWTKNTSSFSYEATITYPSGDATGSYTGSYTWSESTYIADSGNPKTEGWITSSMPI